MTGVAPLAAGSAAQAPAPRALGQEDFLLLLTTQLKAQDPLSPMDNSAFVAQLAQFATVSGVTALGTGIDRLAQLVGGETRHAAPGWIGRTVTGPDGLAGLVTHVRIGPDAALALGLADGRTIDATAITQVE